MKPSGAHTKKVLVVPLSWGLGHATRLIPIVHALRELNMDVLAAGGTDQLKILSDEFPDIQCLKLPSLKIRLSGRRSQIGSIALQLPKIGFHILREHIRLKRLIRHHPIDAIISDNCYGLWNRQITSIFITHQLWIKLPPRLRRAEKLVNRINHWFMARFDACWVPDLPENGGLAGELSHAEFKNIKVRYLGLLSRFSSFPANEKKNASPLKNIVILLSGPEGQRTRFETILLEQLRTFRSEHVIKIVRGLPSETHLPGSNWFNHLPTRAMHKLLLEADHVICRAGYSTLMDLVCLGKTATLVPTPGQTEQEYLAEYTHRKGIFGRMLQEDFLLERAIEESTKTELAFRPDPEVSRKLLSKILTEFVISLTGEIRSDTDKN